MYCLKKLYKTRKIHKHLTEFQLVYLGKLKILSCFLSKKKWHKWKMKFKDLRQSLTVFHGTLRGIEGKVTNIACPSLEIWSSTKGQ